MVLDLKDIVYLLDSSIFSTKKALSVFIVVSIY